MVLVITGGGQLHIKTAVLSHLSQKMVKHLDAGAYLPLATAVKVKF
jgi:hypothetical protein